MPSLCLLLLCDDLCQSPPQSSERHVSRSLPRSSVVRYHLPKMEWSGWVFKNEFSSMSGWNWHRAIRESQTQGSNGGLDRSAAKWLGLSSSEGTRINRRHALRWWLVSNGLWTSRNPRLVPPASRPEYWWKLVAEVDATVGKIRAGRLDPYGSVNKL